MTSFLDVVEAEFGSKDLYFVLGVEREAKEGEIRRAYHRLSLRVHPDRVEPAEVDTATKKFQVLGKIYSVLSDKDTRAIYDEDGTVDEEDSAVFKQDRDWEEYWRLLFPKVTLSDIKKFEERYKGSEEERDTLKTLYLEKEGNMDVIMEEMLCASFEDEPRFRGMIEEWIASDEVPPYPAFASETERQRNTRKRKGKAEAKEAEKALEELGAGANGETSLTALIQARQASRGANVDSFFSSLEEKYCKKQKTSSKKGSGSGSSQSRAGGSQKKGQTRKKGK